MSTDPYAAFASFYDGWSSRMTEDIDFYVRRAMEASGPVVELGAGTGRVSIPIAEAGRDVIAVDASAAMIARGRDKAEAAAVADRITWVEARMQDFVAVPPVELVMIPFRSFIHLTTTAEQLAALSGVAASLVPGGRLALNMFIPDPQVMVERARPEPTVEDEFFDERGHRCVMASRSVYEATTQRLHLTTVNEVFDGDRLLQRSEAALEARLVFPVEMEHLLARSGFEVEALYGWFDERPLTEECREMIWVARKP